MTGEPGRPGWGVRRGGGESVGAGVPVRLRHGVQGVFAMNRLRCSVAFAAALVVSLTGSAEAQSSACSNTTLGGAWGYTETGSVIARSPTGGTVTLAAAAVGRYVFTRTGTFEGDRVQQLQRCRWSGPESWGPLSSTRIARARWRSLPSATVCRSGSRRRGHRSSWTWQGAPDAGHHDVHDAAERDGARADHDDDRATSARALPRPVGRHRPAPRSSTAGSSIPVRSCCISLRP